MSLLVAHDTLRKTVCFGGSGHRRDVLLHRGYAICVYFKAIILSGGLFLLPAHAQIGNSLNPRKTHNHTHYIAYEPPTILSISSVSLGVDVKLSIPSFVTTTSSKIIKRLALI